MAKKLLGCLVLFCFLMLGLALPLDAANRKEALQSLQSIQRILKDYAAHGLDLAANEVLKLIERATEEGVLFRKAGSFFTENRMIFRFGAESESPPYLSFYSTKNDLGNSAVIGEIKLLERTEAFGMESNRFEIKIFNWKTRNAGQLSLISPLGVGEDLPKVYDFDLRASAQERCQTRITGWESLPYSLGEAESNVWLLKKKNQIPPQIRQTVDKRHRAE